MQNRLKEATTPSLNALREANVRSIMATGDNALTAVAVARECGLIPRDAHVFLGDTVKKSNGKDKIVWKSTTN